MEVRESPCYLYGNRTAAYESMEAVGASGPPAGGLNVWTVYHRPHGSREEGRGAWQLCAPRELPCCEHLSVTPRKSGAAICGMAAWISSGCRRLLMPRSPSPSCPWPGLDPPSAQNRSWYPEDHAARTVWFKQVPELYDKVSYSADMVLKVGLHLHDMCVY